MERYQRAQHRQQFLRIMLDRSDPCGAEDVREGAAHHVAVGQHVRDAGRHAQIVLQHDEGAILAADQIGAADIDVGAVRDGEPTHLAAVMVRAVNQLARHHAVLQHQAVAIDILQEKVERRDALRQPALDARPFGGRDDARQKIGRDDALCGLGVRIDREGDALMQE